VTPRHLGEKYEKKKKGTRMERKGRRKQGESEETRLFLLGEI
jgi:hypothetical protein